MGTREQKPPRQRGVRKSDAARTASRAARTPIEQCVEKELNRYFDMLDGEPPCNLYKMVVGQVERQLIHSVMHQCGHNQSKAAKWLGISRGNLRNKLSEMDKE